MYRWNRACFGFSDGKPHLRIENRVLPSGPTVLDEIANAAFLLGLLSGGPAVYGDITTKMAFHDAETNFLAAAQVGLDAQFTWIDGQIASGARLDSSGVTADCPGRAAQRGIVTAEDIDRYLGVIAARVASGQTGSQWLLRSLAAMHDGETKDARLSALTAATVPRQWEGKPVHEWPVARVEEGRAKTLS